MASHARQSFSYEQCQLALANEVEAALDLAIFLRVSGGLKPSVAFICRATCAIAADRKWDAGSECILTGSSTPISQAARRPTRVSAFAATGHTRAVSTRGRGSAENFSSFPKPLAFRSRWSALPRSDP